MNTTIVVSQSIPDLFKRIIDLAKRTASRNVVLGLIAVAPGLLIMTAGWFAETGTGLDSGELTEHGTPAHFLSRFLMIAGFIIVLAGDLWCTLGGIHIAEKEDANVSVTVPQALKHTGRGFLSAITFSVLEILVLGAFALFGIFVIMLVGMPVLVFTEGGAGADVISTVFGVLAAAVIMLPAIYLLVAWSLGLNAIVIDDSGPVDAFSRSKFLVKGAWWKIFLITVAATAAYQLASFAVTELMSLSGLYSSPVPPSLEYPEAFDFAFLERFLRNMTDDKISMGLTYMLAMLVVPVYSTVLYLARRAQKDSESSHEEVSEQTGNLSA